MPTLTDDELDAFLDEREHEHEHPDRIATVVDDVHPPGEDDAWRERYRAIAERDCVPGTKWSEA